MEVKQTLKWLKEQFEKDSDTTFLNLNWDRFDELFEQAKKMDDEFLEKLKDFDVWKEWKNSSMKTELTYEERIAWFVENYYESGMEYQSLLVTMKDEDLDNFKWYNDFISIPKYKVESKFGTYMENKESATKLTGDKITRFVERLKKIGIDVKLSGNFPWVYIDEICGKRVTEKFEGNHGFTLIFLPGRNDSPVSEFTDITEIFKLIRRYSREARLTQMMKDDEENGLYEEL